MEAARTSVRQKEAPRSSDGERRCLATGEMLPKDGLIRFVIGPDRSVVPDLARNLPGRGLWVKAERAAVETAARKNLFAKAAKEPAKPAADLADRIAALLERRCLDHLGLACRAGIAVLGERQVEAALKDGKLALLLVADDAKRDMGIYASAPDIDASFTRHELGAAFGYAQSVYVGLMPHAITVKLKADLSRLRAMKAETVSTPESGRTIQ